jgi:hypothetical protein
VNRLKKEQQRTSCLMLLVLLFHALSLVTVISLLLCKKSYLQTTDDSHKCQPNATSFNVITCTRQVSTAAYGYGPNIPSNMGYCTYSDPQNWVQSLVFDLFNHHFFLKGYIILRSFPSRSYQYIF